MPTRPPRAPAAVLLALLLLAASARAAPAVASSSTLATAAVAPPVRWELGAGGASARYFTGLSATTNATAVAGRLLAGAGADLTVYDALRLVNARASPQSVTLTAAQVANAPVEVFTWSVYDGATLVGTLDMRAASPSLTFALPASTTYRLDARLDLADGAGNHDAPTSFALSLAVGSSSLRVAPGASTLAASTGTVAVPFGALIAGSSVGANATNATASVAGRTVVSGTDNVLYLNNTATTPSWVKLVYVSGTAGFSALTTLNLGVNNGTASTDQIKLASGAVNQGSGGWTRLEASSTNRIYATTLEGLLFGSGTLTFDVLASDTSDGASYVRTKGALTVT